jgi:4-amino-4-deoxy-L-arabinose transferase-like glycosyltransferase
LKKIFESKPFLVVVLLVGICFTLSFQLGNRGLNEPDEGRYSEMGREMLVTGDWLVPHLNGVPHYAKPPWIYWCVALSFKLFGFNEWAARLPSAIAAAFTAWVVYCFGRKMESVVAGVISSLILVSMGLFFFTARLITPDMVLTACITFSIYCFWSWQFEGCTRSRWLWLMYVTMGIGFLDKGLLAIAIVFLTIIPFILIEKRYSYLLHLKLIPGLVLVLAIALPWFLILCQLNPELYDFYLNGEIKDRLVSGHGRYHEVWYHLAFLPLDCWPWTLFIGYAIWIHVQRWRASAIDSPISIFLLCWFAVPFIFYSLLNSKLPTYILPVMPPLSLILGVWWGRWVQSSLTAPWWSRLLTACLCPFPVLFVYGFDQYHAILLSGAHPDWKFWISWIFYALLAVGLFLIIVLKLIFRLPKALRLSILWIISVGSLHFVIYNLPRYDTDLGHNSSWRSVAEALKGIPLVGVPIQEELHPIGKKLAFVRPGPRVVMYDFFYRSCSFYLMKDKPEVVPLYAGESIYEMESDKKKEVKLERDDLIDLLKGNEKVYCFTHPDQYNDVKQRTGMELPILKEAGSKGEHVILFSN